MQTYQDLLRLLLRQGTLKDNRTGTPTLAVTGHMMRFDLADGFPLITTKQVFFRGIAEELLWFLKGGVNVKELRDAGVKIWNEWADDKGNIGPMYGSQWTNWNGVGINQIDEAIHLLRTQPTSRRIIVSAWNPEQLPKEGLSPSDNACQGFMALAPCHALFQFHVTNNKLSCSMYQRSADVFLGVPFNIASYALLTTMVAQQVGLELGDLIWMGGDVHLYTNHIEQAETQLDRTPYPLPTLKLKRKPASIYDYTYEDFALLNYVCHPIITGKISV
jgi:thymidylate synthase